MTCSQSSDDEWPSWEPNPELPPHSGLCFVLVLWQGGERVEMGV